MDYECGYQVEGLELVGFSLPEGLFCEGVEGLVLEGLGELVVVEAVGF